jgi:tRNA pseudouridine55 synthase
MKGAPEVLHAADSLVSSPMHGKMPYDGYVLLDKTPGSTSFDALHILKRAFGTKKIGHTGTLDKFAQGLMVILIGRATRLAQWFSEGDKTYVADFFFGT